MRQQEIVICLASPEEARQLRRLGASLGPYEEMVLAATAGQPVGCMNVHYTSTLHGLNQLCEVIAEPGCLPALVMIPLSGSGEPMAALRYVITDLAACWPVQAIFEVATWNPSSGFERTRGRVLGQREWLPWLRRARLANMAEHLKGRLNVRWEGPLPFEKILPSPGNREWMRPTSGG